MEAELQDYLQTVTKLITIQQQLAQAVEAIVEVYSPVSNLDSVIQGNTVREVIRNFPPDIMVPTAVWIRPPKGVMTVQSNEWEFFFHGQGVSFTCVATGQDVSVEYSVGGRIDATSSWCVWVFINSSNWENSFLSGISHEEHERLFSELVRRGYLEPLPYLDLWPEPLFVLAERHREVTLE
jgi:hypothetical protein